MTCTKSVEKRKQLWLELLMPWRRSSADGPDANVGAVRSSGFLRNPVLRNVRSPRGRVRSSMARTPIRKPALASFLPPSTPTTRIASAAALKLKPRSPGPSAARLSPSGMSNWFRVPSIGSTKRRIPSSSTIAI